MNPPPLSFRQICTLGLIMAVAAGLRFYRIGQASLWMDEILSIELAMGKGTVHDAFPDGIIRYDQPDPSTLSGAAPWTQIWSHTQITTHPPLFFIALRWWVDLFGTGPAAARALSAILSLAAILVFFDLCRLLYGPRIALLAAALMALAIGQIDIAQDARSYPMVTFIALCCADALIRIELLGATRLRLAAIAGFACTLLLTHYFAFGVYVVLIAYALIRLRGRDRRRAIGVLLAALVIAAALWGRGLYWQTRMAPSLDPSYLREDLPHHALQTIVRILKLPLIYLVGDELATAVPLAGHIAVALIVLFLPIVQLRRRKDLLIWVLWIWAVIGMATAIDLAHDSTILKVSRYTVLAAPAAFAILAAFDWPAQMRWRNALPLALIACLAVTNGLRLRRPPQPKQDFQFLSQIVDARAAPDELLVFYNDSGWVSPGVWYVCYRYYSPQSRHPWMALHHPADASALAQLRNHKILWLIGRQPEIDGPTILPGWVPQEVWPTSAGRVCLMRKLPNAP